MEFIEIVKLLGIPSLVMGALFGYLIKKIKDQRSETEAVKLGVQALLRSQMIDDYNRYAQDKGFAPIYAKENFENCYKRYHDLGANGVMTDIYNKFLALPTEGKADETDEKK